MYADRAPQLRYEELLERNRMNVADNLILFVENDTLARISTSCLQQLLRKNVKKLSPARWDHVATTFVKLFRTTTPHQLFNESLRVEIDGSTTDLSDNGMPSSLPKKKLSKNYNL
ncbi:hypothetical protein QCA50_019405 [Cerrena zonata]|uniref:Uncharacterized protein n=1 Tax=Cerrena zonata TaxID=2478898 RepID=A0AAW0FDW9_9APHY